MWRIGSWLSGNMELREGVFQTWRNSIFICWWQKITHSKWQSTFCKQSYKIRMHIRILQELLWRTRESTGVGSGDHPWGWKETERSRPCETSMLRTTECDSVSLCHQKLTTKVGREQPDVHHLAVKQPLYPQTQEGRWACRGSSVQGKKHLLSRTWIAFVVVIVVVIEYLCFNWVVFLYEIYPKDETGQVPKTLIAVLFLMLKNKKTKKLQLASVSVCG